MGSHSAQDKGEVQLSFTPHFDFAMRLLTTAFVIGKNTSDITCVFISLHIVNEFKDLTFADSIFFKPSPVDILLGVNIFFTILNGKIKKK